MRLLSVVKGIGLMLVLQACASSVPPKPEEVQPPVPAPVVEGPVRVGLLLPLSGNADWLGNEMLQAAQMALFDAGDNDVELLPRDTGGTPQGAAAAARDVLDEGVQLILGPLFGQSARAVAPLARAANVPMLTFSTDAQVASQGVYVLGFRPKEQVERIIGFSVSQGLLRIGALVPGDAYGQSVLEAFPPAIGRNIGAEMGPIASYPAEASDASPIVRDFADYDERALALEVEKEPYLDNEDPEAVAALQKLDILDTFGDPPFDAVMLADVGARLRSIASLLTFYDVDPATVRFLGTMPWQGDRDVLTEPALEGAWFAAIDPGSLGEFNRRFADTFGQQPDSIAALAYDATALSVVLSMPTANYSALALTDSDGFVGRSGIFRLRPDGLTDHGLAVLEIGPGGIVTVIDPAPTSFRAGIAQR